MLRYSLVFLVASLAFAQNPADLFNKPPAGVDKALRERITEFYQLQVDGKFRQAEALVAEDTKDYYYNMNKSKYLSFEIGKIVYSDDFTRAKATVLGEQNIPVPGFAGQPIKFPQPTTWKLVDGQWYWYVDQSALRQSPFGVLNPGPPAAGGAMAQPRIPTSAADIDALMNRLKSQVKADKQVVTLKIGEPAQVTLTNGAEGAITLSVSVDAPGVDAKLDHAELKAGEKAILTVRAGDQAKPGVVNIRVEQTTQIIPIQITLN